MLYELNGSTLIDYETEEEREERQILVPDLRNRTDMFVWQARISFLNAMQRLTPIALRSLRYNVLPVFRKINIEVRRRVYADIPDDKFIRLFRERGVREEYIIPCGIAPRNQGFLPVLAASTLRAVAEEFRPEFKPVCEGLLAWARQLNLTQATQNANCPSDVPEWVQDAAWGTLNVWDRRPKLLREMSWHPPELLMLTRRFCGDSRPKFKKDQKQHYDWLALFQVQRQSPRQIAEQLTSLVSENGILRGIYSAAEVVGLTPRPGARGPHAKR